MILSFAVQNFRCFHERIELDLVSSRLRTKVPREGTWPNHVEPVAAIFGANASGKSTVLDAVRHLAEAVQRPGAAALRQPHRGHRGSAPTVFEVDFVADSHRYSYRVEACAWGIRHESLDEYATARPRRLFLRTQDSQDSEIVVEKGPSLTGPTQEVRKLTGSAMLFLAVALRYDHKQLAPIARALAYAEGISFLSFRDKVDAESLHRVVLEMAAAPDDQVELVGALLRAADLGIESVDVQQEEIPEDVRAQAQRLLAALNDGELPPDAEVPRLMQRVRFQHRSAAGATFALPLAAESSGTLTWLATAWQALKTLSTGGVLLVDELDASLHPDLVRYVVTLFAMPQTNIFGAQLVFTSHDASLLGNAPTKALQPQQVWFTQKDAAGNSELFSLADFDLRAGSNTERQYLAGRFGAVPDIDEALLLRFLATSHGQDR